MRRIYLVLLILIIIMCYSASAPLAFAVEESIEVGIHSVADEIKHKESVDWIIIKDATCSKVGFRAKYCTECNIVLKIEIIKPNGIHSAIKTVGKKNATYFKKGYTGDVICSDCKKVISEGKSIAKLKLDAPKVSVTGKNNKIIVKYKKVKGATGFQIKYYKLKGKVVTKTYNKNKTIKKSIVDSEFTINKVRVRAFVKHGSKKIYSPWTQVNITKFKV